MIVGVYVLLPIARFSDVVSNHICCEKLEFFSHFSGIGLASSQRKLN